MGFYTGRSGSLKYDGKIVAKIRDWSVETTLELLPTNSIDSTFNTFTPGVKGATGSATLMYYRLEGEESGGGAADDIKMYAYITSAQVSVSTGELSVVPIQFTMDGDFNQVIA
jgi:hypothetical protein